MYKTQGIKKWIGYIFKFNESDVKQFKSLSNSIKAEIDAQVYQEGCELITFTRGYFGISGFISNADRTRFVYFSVPDVRDMSVWYKHILVREAESEKDYRGGINNYTSLDNFGTAVNKLMNGRKFI